MINNKWVDSQSKETFETINPSTGKPICQVSRGKVADIDLAVKSAKNAFEKGVWSEYEHTDRRNLLIKIADNLEKNIE